MFLVFILIIGISTTYGSTLRPYAGEKAKKYSTIHALPIIPEKDESDLSPSTVARRSASPVRASSTHSATAEQIKKGCVSLRTLRRRNTFGVVAVLPFTADYHFTSETIKQEQKRAFNDILHIGRKIHTDVCAIIAFRKSIARTHRITLPTEYIPGSIESNIIHQHLKVWQPRLRLSGRIGERITDRPEISFERLAASLDITTECTLVQRFIHRGLIARGIRAARELLTARYDELTLYDRYYQAFRDSRTILYPLTCSLGDLQSRRVRIAPPPEETGRYCLCC